MANRQDNESWLQKFRALFRNRRDRQRRRDEEQGRVQQHEMAEFQRQRWRPPTEQSLPARGEEVRQAHLLVQPDGYDYPQMISGWLWESRANRRMGGPHEKTTRGGQVQHVDPRRPSDKTYRTFTDYDEISKRLRDLAPDDKVVGPEDEKKFRSAGIEFGGLIGGGSYGKVFHATVTRPDGTRKPCVVKRVTFADFKDKNSNTLAATKALVREIQVTQKIQDAVEREERAAGRQPSGFDTNKNIIACNNIWRIYQEDTQFPDPIMSLLFLEACDTDLKRVIENTIPNNTKLTENDAKKLFVQIGNALHWLHGLGIVHFDIKPDNIMIKLDPADPRRGQFKLGDFGISEVFPDPGNTVSDLKRGTPLYRAPEVETSLSADRRKADVYMLAATLVISIVGFGPYKMDQGVFKAFYTFYKSCMDMLKKDLNTKLSKRELNVLNRLGFSGQMIPFLRHVCAADHFRRASLVLALSSIWARQWPYQPGFVDLDCLVVRQRLLQQRPAVQHPPP